MRSSIKRLLVLGLAAVMSASTVITSFADEGFNGGGNVNENHPSTIEYVGRTLICHSNQGFRMYVMNGEGTVVSNTVDVVHYRPQDTASIIAVGDAEVNAGVGDWLNYMGYQNKSKDATKNSDSSYGGRESLLYIGSGKADAAGCPLTKTDLMHVEAGKYLMSPHRVNYNKSDSAFNNYTQEKAKMYTYAEMEGFITQAIKAIYGDGVLPESPLVDGKSMPIKIYDPLSDQYGTAENAGMNATGDYMNELLMSTFEKDGATLIQGLLKMGNIPAMYSDGSVGSGEPLFNLYDQRLIDKYNQFQSNGSKDPLLDLIKTEELYLGFEPIHWCVVNAIFIIDGTAYTYNSPYVIYGTGSNAFWYVSKLIAVYILRNKDVFHIDSIPGFSDASYDGQIGSIDDPEAFGKWLAEDIGMGGYSLEFDWCKADEVYMLDHDEPGLHMEVYDPVTEKDLRVFLNGYSSKGYSIMIFKASEGASGTPTWDKEKFPEDSYKPGPSPENTNPDGTPKIPDYPSEGSDYQIPGPDGKKKDHNFNIVKFYAEKQPDGSYVYEENYTRNQAIHDITINDEPGYVVDNYFTSPTFQQPSPTNGPSTQSYDTFKATLPKGSKEGTKAERITVEASSTDTTLYLRLVKTPMLTVKKFFPDGSTKVEVIPWQPSYDPTEPGQIYKSDKQEKTTPDPLPGTWPETTGTPETNPNITVQPTTRTLYILYEGGPTDVVTLEQNELAHTFTMEDIAALLTVKHTFEDKSYSGGSHHHSYNGKGVCVGSNCSWSRVIDDETYSYVISNGANYGSTSFVGSTGPFASVETGTVSESGTFGMTGGTTTGLTPNLKFSIYRDKVKDQATLYPEKNNSVKSVLSNIGITQEGYEPKTTRVSDRGSTQWYSTFTVNYDYGASGATLESAREAARAVAQQRVDDARAALEAAREAEDQARYEYYDACNEYNRARDEFYNYRYYGDYSDYYSYMNRYFDAQRRWQEARDKWFQAKDVTSEAQTELSRAQNGLTHYADTVDGFTGFDNKLTWTQSGCETHGDTGTWYGTETPLTLATLNSTFSKSNNVLTKAYYGQPGKGEKVTELSKQAFNLPGLTRVPSTATFGASGHNATQTFQKSSDNIYFGLYPFVKYVYQTVNNTSDAPAFITSTNLSEIRDNTTVEMGVYYSKTGATNRYAIGLTSEQWSTHARTIEGLTSQNVPAAERNKSLLPGGATVDLRTANTDSSLPESWIGVRIYQTAMPDDLQKTYTQTTQSNTNLKTVSEVQNDVNTFFENLKSILSGYQLEKWAKEGIYLNDSDLDTGATKVSGINPATSLAGNNLSRDSKYYLKEGVSADAADASHIDVIRSDQAVNVYTVSSDTEGKIVVKKNNSVIAQTNLTSTNKQSAINALLSNAEVKRVDDHVKFVTNFITSLDFNEGSDRTGHTWYTEAHDGFAAVEAMGAFQIGFGSASDGTGVGGGAPVRSEVVDPRLTGKLDSKSDVLNFTPATLNVKARTLQYRTSNRSTSPLASSKPDGYMGTFDGIDIIMPNTNTLLRSKLHYLSNVTVQDLN